MIMKKAPMFLMAISSMLMFSCEPNTYSEIEQPVATTTTTTTTPTTSTPTTTTPTTTTTSTTTPTTVSTSKTYTTDIKPIITTNCASCHSGGQSPALSTYTQVKNATSSGKLLCTIQANGCVTMPPSGKMSQANIDLILLWKTQGYLQ